MTVRLSDLAEEAFLDLITGITYTCRLYSNNVTNGLTDAQVNALTAASFTEATFAGYAAVTLTAGAWTSTAGNPAATVYNSTASFVRSSTGTDQPQYGYYITRASDGAYMWHEGFTGAPISIDTAGEQIDVTPRLTGADTVDT